MKLFIIIPVYNESKTILATLNSLLMMDDQDYSVVICNNNSTDDTSLKINNFITKNKLSWIIIDESQKGTGAAADTACRHAILLGATHIARTDADCLPAHDWVSVIKILFETTDLEFLAGISYPRTDDILISRSREKFLRFTNEFAIWFGKIRPMNKGAQYKGKYIMVSGNNLAISSKLYLQVGGFARSRIEDLHEDREMIQKIRLITDRYTFDRNIVVYASSRRIAAWGVLNSLRWYKDHSYREENVDVR